MDLLAKFPISPLLILLGSIFIVFLIIYRRSIVKNIWLYFFISTAFALLGYTVGYSIGLSSEPVVGAIISGLLTFLAGIALYLFSNQKEEAVLRTTIYKISSVLGAISISIMIGEEVGGQRRLLFYETEINNSRQLETDRINKQYEHELLLKLLDKVEESSHTDLITSLDTFKKILAKHYEYDSGSISSHPLGFIMNPEPASFFKEEPVLDSIDSIQIHNWDTNRESLEYWRIMQKSLSEYEQGNNTIVFDSTGRIMMPRDSGSEQK